MLTPRFAMLWVRTAFGRFWVWRRANGAALLVLVISALLFVGAEATSWETAQSACHASNSARKIGNERSAAVREAFGLVARHDPGDMKHWQRLQKRILDTPYRNC